MLFLVLLEFLLSFGVSKELLCKTPKTSFSSCSEAEFCWDLNDPSADGDIIKNVNEDVIWHSVELSTSYGSYCIDGSTPHYYFRPGFNDIENNNDGTTKYYIYLQGGGWCSGYDIAVGHGLALDSCIHRSTTQYGSTKNDGSYIVNDGNYFSRDMSSNPVMYNWNGIYLRYCDGTSYTGHLDDPVYVTKDNVTTPLYFHGAYIIDNMLQSVFNNKSLADPTEFILLGCSAGGLGTYLNADYIIDYVLNKYPNIKNSGAMPDSGFFMDYNSEINNYIGAIKWIYQNQNVTNRLNKQCLQDYKDSEWQCYFARYMSPYISNRLFPLQSQYDAWQIYDILGEPTNFNAIQTFGYNLSNAFIDSIFNKNSNGYKNGCFLSSCEYHCNHWNTITINNISMGNAFYNWYYRLNSNKELDMHFGNSTYPCNICCQ